VLTRNRRLVLGLSLLIAVAACRPAAPAGTAPARCRHHAVVYRNASSRIVDVMTPPQPYSTRGEVLAELAPGDTSAAIPRDRTLGAFVRDAETGNRVTSGDVTADERCLDAPAPQPRAPTAPH